MTTTLYAPASYVNAPPAVRAEICNGCGTKGLCGFVIPDSIWGLDITESCHIHDWAYYEGQTLADKEEADRVFLNNMLRLIDAASGFGPLRWLRRWRAMTYYNAVRDLGGPAFWAGKNKPENLLAKAAG